LLCNEFRMANEPTYFELLKHPKWQKMRLKVLESAEWTCEECGADDRTLNVHHSYYERGLKPWEYPVESLHALCEECHRKQQDVSAELSRQIGKLELSDMPALLGYAHGLEALSYPNTVIDVVSYEHAQGIAHAWELTAEEVIAALRDRQIDGYTLDGLREARRGRQKAT